MTYQQILEKLALLATQFDPLWETVCAHYGVSREEMGAVKSLLEEAHKEELEQLNDEWNDAAFGYDFTYL